MALPAAFKTLSDLHYYQGVLLVEVALTLLFYLVLKIVHYVKWGHAEEEVGAEAEKKPEEKKEGEE